MLRHAIALVASFHPFSVNTCFHRTRQVRQIHISSCFTSLNGFDSVVGYDLICDKNLHDESIVNRSLPLI